MQKSLNCLQVMQVDIVTKKVTLILFPDGEKYLQKYSLPINPKEHLIVFVLMYFDDPSFYEISLFITSTGDDYVKYVSNVLEKKLKQLNMKRYDLFTPTCEKFIHNIKPILKSANESTYYCFLD